MDVIDKSQEVVVGTLGRGWRGRRRRNKETGLSGGASFPLGMAHWASPAHCKASCTDCAKVSMGKGGAKEMHPLEASRALKRISAHIQMADGAGVPGVRMVLMGPGLGWTLPLIRSNARIRRRRKGVRSTRRRGAAQL